MADQCFLFMNVFSQTVHGNKGIVTRKIKYACKSNMEYQYLFNQTNLENQPT